MPEPSISNARNPNLLVHHGRIGSANVLLRDPDWRDELASKFGFRAFEMEGSGIADGTWESGVGYLIVRGIADYGDSAKSDRWHGYASAAAAAYARGILEQIPAYADNRRLSGFKRIARSSSKSSDERAVRASLHHQGQTPPVGRIVGFLSSKGGCGATTVICHIAAELGRQNQRVLLMDLDFNAGIIGFLMKANSPYSIADAANKPDQLVELWKTLVSNTHPGVDVLTASELVSERSPSQSQLKRVLACAQQRYDWILVDLGHGLNSLAMAILQQAERTCLVATIELLALHQSKCLVRALRNSGYKENRIWFILNRVSRPPTLSPEEIEDLIGLPVFYVIPDDSTELFGAYARGELLSHTSQLGGNFSQFAARLAGLKEETAPKKRFGLF